MRAGGGGGVKGYEEVYRQGRNEERGIQGFRSGMKNQKIMDSCRWGVFFFFVFFFKRGGGRQGEL